MALRLLIADDNPDDALLVVFALQRAGRTVEWQRVDDETGFLHALPSAELVICDYSMPRFSPHRALELMRERGCTTPFLLVSGNVSAAVANQILLLGAMGVVMKHQLDRLGQAVCDALAGNPSRGPTPDAPTLRKRD
jgi:CheY-like chemotaxis protein